ncbi:MAG TPA: hypothetical protein VM070_01605 [Candidatus Saccharimonadales bacterium]|nr:hypothetical protein [Candidatus Saccharimonadales bacterium]
MLRQLRRLTRSVPAAGPSACALAVYADASDQLVPARESGEEGVACLDDAARGVVLLADLWSVTGESELRAWATGLLDFVLYLQRPDGRFANFIHDWDGTPNEHGQTSVPGGAFWQARALSGLAKAWVTLDDPRARPAFLRALGPVRGAPAAADVRSVQIRAVLGVVRSGRMPELRSTLISWCDELVALRDGEVLLDAPGTLHLWGHSQEAVLADAGTFLGRGDLITAARRSADLVFGPAIASAFDFPVVQPYDVACAVDAMDRLHAATGEARYARGAAEARAWFDGRNTAGAPVYDRERGRVADGIDQGRISASSGAESNIVAAQALFGEIANRHQAQRLTAAG